MRDFVKVLATLVLALFASVQAAAQQLVADLSSHEIQITTGFFVGKIGRRAVTLNQVQPFVKHSRPNTTSKLYPGFE